MQSLLRCLVLVPAGLLSTAMAQESKPPHVVFVVGENEYQSHATMPALAERLEDSFGWKTTVLIDEHLHATEDNHVAGLDALDRADLLVLFLRFRQWQPDDVAALERYVERGGAIAAFRTTTHAFQYPEGHALSPMNGFGADVLGAPWIFHYGHDSATDVTLPARGQAEGILDGVPDTFRVRSWTYHVRPDYPPKDANVLAMGLPVRSGESFGDDERNPVAWTRTHATGSRVFMTTLGHPEDFRSTAFRRLVGNGMHWALEQPMPGKTLADFPEVIHPDDRSSAPPWERMDYGPFLSTALGIGSDMRPVHKGIVIPLTTVDGSPSDLSAVFDTDLVSWRCVWRGDVALRGIVFDGPHGTFPEIEGEPLLRTAAQPGVVTAAPAADPRDEPFGPVPAALVRYEGLTLEGDDVEFEWTAFGGFVRAWERVWAIESSVGPGLVREIKTSSEAREEFITVRLFDPSRSESGLAATSNDARVTIDMERGTARLPVNGTFQIAITPARLVAGTPFPAKARAFSRQRWGAPLMTRGVVNDSQGPTDVVQRHVQRAGDAPQSIQIDNNGRGMLEVRGPDARVNRSFLLSAPDEVPPEALLSRIEPDDRLGSWPVGDTATKFERNEFTGERDLRLDGVTWRRGIEGRSLDFDGTAAAWAESIELDLRNDDTTVAVWIHTSGDGTVFSIGPRKGDWAPDGASIFLRDGRLTADVGWVGAVNGGPVIADGSWHHVAATWRDGGEDVRLFVDGQRVAAGNLGLKGADQVGFAARFGWTNDDFPATSRFSGYMDGLTVLGTALDDAQVPMLASISGEPFVTATVVRANGPSEARFRIESGVASVDVNASDRDVTFDVFARSGTREATLAWARTTLREAPAAAPFRIDRITWPEDNPHDAWLRFGGFDFVAPDGGAREDATSAMISTWSGDVWRVDGIDERLEELAWTRVATGLNQPFGVHCTEAEEPETLVLGRDQITRLVDIDGDFVADRYENVVGTARNSEHFHEPASGLSATPEGQLVYIKAGRHAKLALHDHHGTVVRVDPVSGETKVLARGFRAPFGLTPLADGTFLGSDQEGHWMPANRINLIRPSAESPRFYGNGWAAQAAPGERIERDGERVQPPWPLTASVEPPLCWIHPKVDRSPSSQVVANHEAWGPLEGSLLGLSYGTGEVYLILREDVEVRGQGLLTQGGIVKLGIQMPTGLLHGRIHPGTGDLYVCGLFGWSSDRTDPGGFYRVRPKPLEWERSLNVPVAMRALESGLELTFLAPLDLGSTTDLDRWGATAWNYRRSSDYGSPTFSLDGERDARTELQIRRVTLENAGRTVRLEIDSFQPCMQLQVNWDIVSRSGLRLNSTAHLTVHALTRDQ